MADTAVRPSSPDGLDLERLLQQFLRSARSRFRAAAASVGLTMPQLFILGRVASLPEATPGDLATELGVTPAAVTFLVAELTRERLLRRSRAARDRRCVVLELTAAGAARLAAAKAEGRRMHASIRRELTDEEIRTLTSALARLAALFDRAPEPSPAVVRPSSAGARRRPRPPPPPRRGAGR